MLKITANALKNPAKEAIVAGGESYNYQALIDASRAFAHQLLASSDDLRETRVAFMVSPANQIPHCTRT